MSNLCGFTFSNGRRGPCLLSKGHSGFHDDQADRKGRWWGKEYCPHPGQDCIDGCYYCGRKVGNATGDHNHTKTSRQGDTPEYSCVCETC